MRDTLMDALLPHYPRIHEAMDNEMDFGRTPYIRILQDKIVKHWRSKKETQMGINQMNEPKKNKMSLLQQTRPYKIRVSKTNFRSSPRLEQYQWQVEHSS